MTSRSLLLLLALLIPAAVLAETETAGPADLAQVARLLEHQIAQGDALVALGQAQLETQELAEAVGKRRQLEKQLRWANIETASAEQTLEELDEEWGTGSFGLNGEERSEREAESRRAHETLERTRLQIQELEPQLAEAKSLVARRQEKLQSLQARVDAYLALRAP